jgi:hypothetical protein
MPMLRRYLPILTWSAVCFGGSHVDGGFTS